MYSSADILRAACARGVGVVLGSDSHAPDQVGRYFDKALGLLQDAGYNTVDRSGRLPSYTTG